MKKKLATSIPVIYQSLTRDASRQHDVICEDVHGQFFRHTNAQSINVLRQFQHKVWVGFDAFVGDSANPDNPGETRQTILAYHSMLFKAEPPPKQDHVTTALYVWFGLCDIAVDRTEKTPRTTEGRKMTIGARKYMYGDSRDLSMIGTPQARSCYRIFCDAIDEITKKNLCNVTEKSLVSQYVPAITEEALRAVVVNRAGELHTRQDPWRIFQYYRPQLIKHKLIRHD